MTVSARILLVEDEMDVAEMLKVFFTWRGYEFHHAADGEEALDLASRVMPHVILMDITLPDTDGYALTIKLRFRPRTAHIPIIFLTKWNSRDRRLTGLALGADDYVTKPFDLQELLLRVQNSIARAAREYLTDLRTGLPAAYTARERLTEARTDPQQAIIEITLENSAPFLDVYGSAAGAEVYQEIGNLMLSVLNNKGEPDDFIGYLDEEHFVIVTGKAHAHSVAEQIAAVFNDQVRRHYSDGDTQRGTVVIKDRTYPLMRLLCRITAGDKRTELS